MQIKTAHTIVSFAFLALTLITIQGCKLGYNKTPKRNVSNIPAPVCADEPANPNTNEDARAVFKLLSDLTCNNLAKSQDGAFMGQSLGNGNQISQNDHINSYAKHIDAFKTETSKTPALIAIDYEYERLYTNDELLEANVKLKAHWDKGGLVTITWTPLNPWTNNFSDLENTKGSHEDTQYSDGINLKDLIDDSTKINETWRLKLDAVANALLDLQTKGVSVLWRPLPKMNTNTYWWGLDANVINDNKNDASLYTDLWVHMYEYFKDKELQNLLWVYSPAESTNIITVDPTDITNSVNTTTVDRAYPGDKWVDVIAGIAKNDLLNIKDYVKLKDFNKPLGMAEYGPKPQGQYTTEEAGTFDNQTYADRLDGSYNFVSYWVSWHSSENNMEALADNKNSTELTKRISIFNIEDGKRN